MLVDYSKLENHINVYRSWLAHNDEAISMNMVWEIARDSKQLPDFQDVFIDIVLIKVKEILITQYNIESLEQSSTGILTANNIVLEKLSDFKKLSKKFVQEGEVI